MVLTSETDIEFQNYNTEFPFHTAVAKGKFAAAISTVQSLSNSERIINETMFRDLGPDHLCYYLGLAGKYRRSKLLQIVLDPCPPFLVFPDCGKDRFIVAYLNSKRVSVKFNQEMNARVEILCDLVYYIMILYKL